MESLTHELLDALAERAGQGGPVDLKPHYSLPIPVTVIREMLGIEAGGHGIQKGEHAARFQGGKLGVLQGTKTWLLADDDGQIELTHSVSAGLDYPGVGPEHAWLKDTGRATYVAVNDDEALASFHDITRAEGIIPALESSHALAYAAKLAPGMSTDDIVIVNLSGRGDKDIQTVAAIEGMEL